MAWNRVYFLGQLILNIARDFKSCQMIKRGADEGVFGIIVG